MISSLYAPKQLEVLKRVWSEDFFICGLHGAKRSGKTVVNNDIFLSELKRVKEIAKINKVREPMYILAGTSSTSVQNNILQELYNKYDFDPKFDKHGAFFYDGVKVVQIYTGNLGGLKRARGFTAYGAYVNEASLANETVFKEIISRCSGAGARIVWDSNPDNPNHWLKRDYIDVEDELIINFHFELDDNTFLDERYREAIKRATPSGKFYDRDIKGLWTIAEGAIYADYDEKIHKVAAPHQPIERYFAGVDWGYSHFGSIVILGETADGTLYIVDGWAEQFQEIDFWVKKAKGFKELYGNIDFYADSARPEHVERFKREKIITHNADKAVVSGIEQVARLFRNKKLFYIEGSLPRFEEEIFQYKWNEKSIKDEPVQEWDDVLDAVRYAIYSRKTTPKWLY